jgi:DNA end-binding protein Ku
MAPRPIWKGYLKLSLVSCPVALYSATTRAERVRFHIINRKTGHRIHNEIVDAQTGKPVDDEDQVKGFEIKKGKYVILEDEDFESVALESTHTIDIESFVPRDEVDEIYLDGSYYMVPTDKTAAEAFAVIREAMEKEDVVGLARAVMYRREKILMLQPRGKGLMATALRYNNEVREEKTYFREIPSERISSDTLKLAQHIVSTKMGHFDPDKFEDRYENALKKVIKAKQEGKELPEPERPRGDNVIDLMDALRKSVDEAKGRGGKATKKTKRASQRKLKRAS